MVILLRRNNQDIMGMSVSMCAFMDILCEGKMYGFDDGKLIKKADLPVEFNLADLVRSDEIGFCEDAKIEFSPSIGETDLLARAEKIALDLADNRKYDLVYVKTEETAKPNHAAFSVLFYVRKQK